MAEKVKSIDDLAEAFEKLLTEATSTDTLREKGVPERMVALIEAQMVHEGLDPKRSTDVRLMLESMLEATLRARLPRSDLS